MPPLHKFRTHTTWGSDIMATPAVTLFNEEEILQFARPQYQRYLLMFKSVADMVEARRRRKSLLFVITREEVTAVKWYDATTH